MTLNNFILEDISYMSRLVLSYDSRGEEAKGGELQFHLDYLIIGLSL